MFLQMQIFQMMFQKNSKKNISTTFNAITCDGDTSTNDMVSNFFNRKDKTFKN